jgi:hypothetical protein
MNWSSNWQDGFMLGLTLGSFGALILRRIIANVL